MSKSFDDLRQLHKEFIYKGYSISRIPDPKSEGTGEVYHVCFDMEITGLSEFKAVWDFPVSAARVVTTSVSDIDLLDDPIFKELIFALGLTECISYYKIACPKEFRIDCASLSSEEILWWRKLIYNGLGEFMYRNGIDVTEEELVNITCAGSPVSTRRSLHDSRGYSGYLVPVGGGKDSVVSLEILKNEDIVTYTVNGNDTTRAVIDVCEYKSGDYVARRVLDKRMLDLNSEGYLNGHTPFSAIIAFSSVITAYILGKKYITLSNENSANESTVRGSFVNHQYSKSYEFEKDFMMLLRSITDSDIHYFSMLRPLTELQIAALFSDAIPYHKVFRSCNVGSKKGIWCGDCPKCLFVYIILSPFISEDKLTEIFGSKLLDKESLDKDFRELIGIEENKPFECVGTRAEVSACMKHYRLKGGISLLTDRYADYIDAMPYDGTSPIISMLSDWNNEHNVPDIISDKVRKAIEEYAISYKG